MFMQKEEPTQIKTRQRSCCAHRQEVHSNTCLIPGGHHKILTESVATSILQPLGRKKETERERERKEKVFKDTSMLVTRHCRITLTSDCRRQPATFTTCNTCSCWKVEEDSWLRRRLHWKITMPSARLQWSSVKLSHVQLGNSTI